MNINLCPYCGQENVEKTSPNRYACNVCGREFSPEEFMDPYKEDSLEEFEENHEMDTWEAGFLRGVENEAEEGIEKG